jgi:hypothetical protein
MIRVQSMREAGGKARPFWTDGPGGTGYYPIDTDAQTFATLTGASELAKISEFVKGMKSASLWDTLVCWPMLPGFNYGTGATVASFGGLGTYNGTITGGSWTSDGVYLTPGGSSSRIAHSAHGNAAFNTNGATILVVSKLLDSTWIHVNNWGLIELGGVNISAQGVANNRTLGVSGVVAIQTTTISGGNNEFRTTWGTVTRITGSGNYTGAVAADGDNFPADTDCGTRSSRYNYGLIGAIDNNVGGRTGHYALVICIAKRISNAEKATLYALLKVTLCSGLSLP